MNKRVKLLRNTLDMSQEEFGKKLGIGKTAVSKIEKGENKLTDQNINLICSITWDGNKRVNAEWIKSGKGDMFLDSTIDEFIASLINNIPNSPTAEFQKKFLSVLSRLTEEQWKLLNDIIEQMMDGISKGKSKSQITADAEEAYRKWSSMEEVRRNEHDGQEG